MCLTFEGFGYTKCKMEPCVLYRQADEGVVIIIVAVDDLTLTASNQQLLGQAKAQLKSQFKVSDLGPIHWILGIEVKWNRATRTVTLSQKAYIDTIVTKFRLDDARPISMPMETGVQLATTQASKPVSFPYKEIISSLHNVHSDWNMP